MFTPSKYQSDIYSWVKTGKGDCVVQATAGSGKTSTLVEVAKQLHTDNAIFLAFNKHIVEELQRRLPEKMAVKTIHSIGYGALMKSGKKFKSPSDNKYRNICKDVAVDIKHETKADVNSYILSSELLKVANFARLTLTDYRNLDKLWEMIDHFGIDITEPGFVLPYVGKVIEEGNAKAKYAGEIDFTDMIWLPHAWNLYPKQYEFVLADEAQDFSEAQLQIAMKCRGKGGRMLFVGDSRQAIMAFAGSNNDSLDRIIKATGATILPLSICYRCPTSHIALAQKIVPEIEAAPNAVEGIVDIVNENELHSKIQEGDLIVCRMTAPLVSLCIELITRKIPARVKGRDISKQLTLIVEDVSKMPRFRYDDFGIFLADYENVRVTKLRQRDNAESLIEQLEDRCAGVLACFESFDCKDVQCLTREIEDLFSDARASVTLSTVHKCKGLENKRVFILKPEKLPLRWKGQKAHELIQEYNLRFISLTRAKESLFFIEESEKKEKQKVASVSRFEIGESDDDF